MLSITSQSFKAVDRIINILMKKNDGNNILKRTIHIKFTVFAHHRLATISTSFYMSITKSVTY